MRFYYVTVIRGKEWLPALGPFDTHEVALASVSRARELGYNLDPKTHFDEWGTSLLPDGYTKPGILNQYMEKTT